MRERFNLWLAQQSRTVSGRLERRYLPQPGRRPSDLITSAFICEIGASFALLGSLGVVAAFQLGWRLPHNYCTGSVHEKLPAITPNPKAPPLEFSPTPGAETPKPTKHKYRQN